MAFVDELVREGVLRTPRVIEAFRAVRRADFVPEEFKKEAETLDAPVPIGGGQTISQPWTVAFMLELLDPQPGQRILDIGAGSGWQTALLAHIVRSSLEERAEASCVYAIERIPALCEFCKKNLLSYGLLEQGVVHVVCGDATKGLAEHAPYDRIIAAASVESLPEAWRAQCRIGGIIVAPVRGSVWRLRRVTETRWGEEEYPGFAFVPFISEQREKR